MNFKSLLFLFLYTSFSAQIFSENFNLGNLPNGWTVENPSSSENWKIGNQSNFAMFPTNAAFFDDDHAAPSSMNSSAKLISPIIDLSNANAPSLSFKYANMVYTVNTSITMEGFNGKTWVKIFENFGNAGEWTIDQISAKYIVDVYADAKNIDLSAFRNSDFKLRFIYNDMGTYSYGAVIDDILINNGTLSSQVSIVDNDLKVYPNPVQNYFEIISSKIIRKVSVVDISGRVLKQFNAITKEYNIVKHLRTINKNYDISNLSKGVYYLIIETSTGTIHKKIIKE